ncbi:hypothetical protein [Nocardia sp. NPDC050435]|uniref:hypothetical protein n=1 Tax=Nocardia sp. NPDC050435 TaxID=3155040 RepID=UPI0033D935AB
MTYMIAKRTQWVRPEEELAISDTLHGGVVLEDLGVYTVADYVLPPLQDGINNAVGCHGFGQKITAVVDTWSQYDADRMVAPLLNQKPNLNLLRSHVRARREYTDLRAKVIARQQQYPHESSGQLVMLNTAMGSAERPVQGPAIVHPG